jgi:predicted DNA-binding protein (MmcQ/YjbR family)
MLAWMVPAGLRCRPARRPTFCFFLYTEPMKPNDFRQIALRFQDAIEGEHMAHPDFRVNGRIFATLHPDGKQGMVKVTPDQQRDFIHQHPAFTPASGAWGRQGCTMVLLNAVDEETLGEAMTLAWQLAVTSGKVKSQKLKVKTKVESDKPARTGRKRRR